uniref:FAD dependent oxidoreductase domain-containing protein n=1 Tax=Oryza glumipatula TaxID=40148 RepID=A0A0E0BTR7_9ORYZ
MGPRSDPALRAAIENDGAAEVVGASDDSAASWPWSAVFRLPEGWTAASSELGGVIKATKAVAMFQSLAAKNGAVLRDRTEVIDIAKQVGAWASKLVKSVAGVDLPVQPLHTLICYWKARPGREHELTPESGFPTFASYGDTCIYSTPSMEFPGLIKVCAHGGAPCDPDRRDWCAGGDALADPVARWIDELMPGHVDTAGGPVIRQSCMYSMTPDEDFIIDFVGGEFGKDVVVGAGFSGHGFKMGPAVGRILAEMAMDGEAKTAAEAGVELGYFRIGRFEGNPEGNRAENKMSHRSTLLQMLLDEESLSDGDEEFISSAVDIVYDEFDDDEVPKRGGSVIHYFNGLKLISTLVKLMPEWLCNNRVISALVDNMN